AGLLGSALCSNGGNALGGSPSETAVSDYKTPQRRPQLTGMQRGLEIPSLAWSPGSAASSIATPSASISEDFKPMLALGPPVGWPLPWGPPPAISRVNEFVNDDEDGK
ncbi:unnamed protein product, partial [Polarella glacialis]